MSGIAAPVIVTEGVVNGAMIGTIIGHVIDKNIETMTERISSSNKNCSIRSVTTLEMSEPPPVFRTGINL